MDRQQISLKLVLDAVGEPLDLSAFDKRLILQKSIYLLQAARVDLGYSFNWYLKGPYSPSLTRDAFALRTALSQNTDEIKDWKLDAPSLTNLDRVNNLLKSIASHERARRLELLASVHFLVQTRQATTTDPQGLRGVLQKNGKEFSEIEVRQAIGELHSHGLLSTIR